VLSNILKSILGDTSETSRSLQIPSPPHLNGLPLDRTGTQLFGSESLSGLHRKWTLRQRAGRCHTASISAGPCRDVLHLFPHRAGGLGANGGISGWCGATLSSDPDRHGNPSPSGGRNWDESEYCVDAKSGLLTTYSIAPGIFVHYDCSGGIQFYGKSIPTSFKIVAAGRTVVESRTIRVTEPPPATDALFNPAGQRHRFQSRPFDDSEPRDRCFLFL